MSIHHICFAATSDAARLRQTRDGSRNHGWACARRRLLLAWCEPKAECTENLSVPFTLIRKNAPMIDDNTMIGEVRAGVSYARDMGQPVDSEVCFTLAIADLLNLPDNVRIVPAVTKAMSTPTRLDLPDSIERTRNLAIIAGSH
jgi:hypothetical protein